MDNEFINACRVGDFGVVQKIVHNVNRSDTYNAGFDIACRKGYLDIVNLFLECKLNLFHCIRIYEGLVSASDKGQFKVVELMIHSGLIQNNSSVYVNDVINTSHYFNQALTHACQHGFLEIARLLIEHASVNEFENPIFTACASNHLEIAELIIEHDNSKIETAMLWACQYCRPKIVKSMIQRGAKRVNCGLERLVRNCPRSLCDAIEIAKILIDAGAHNFQHCYRVLISRPISNLELQILAFIINARKGFNKFAIYDCTPLYELLECGVDIQKFENTEFVHSLQFKIDTFRNTVRNQNEILPVVLLNMISLYSLH